MTNIASFSKDAKSTFTIHTCKAMKVYSVSETLTTIDPIGANDDDMVSLRSMFNGVTYRKRQAAFIKALSGLS